MRLFPRIVAEETSEYRGAVGRVRVLPPEVAHRIEAGAESSSYGVHVARLAGLPPQVTDRAGEILTRLEAEGVKDFAG